MTETELLQLQELMLRYEEYVDDQPLSLQDSVNRVLSALDRDLSSGARKRPEETITHQVAHGPEFAPSNVGADGIFNPWGHA